MLKWFIGTFLLCLILVSGLRPDNLFGAAVGAFFTAAAVTAIAATLRGSKADLVAAERRSQLRKELRELIFEIGVAADPRIESVVFIFTQKLYTSLADDLTWPVREGCVYQIATMMPNPIFGLPPNLVEAGNVACLIVSDNWVSSEARIRDFIATQKRELVHAQRPQN